jgi:hypothetical protein
VLAVAPIRRAASVLRTAVLPSTEKSSVSVALAAHRETSVLLLVDGAGVTPPRRSSYGRGSRARSGACCVYESDGQRDLLIERSAAGSGDGWSLARP